MKSLLIVAALVLAVQSRPEAAGAYNYQIPSTAFRSPQENLHGGSSNLLGAATPLNGGFQAYQAPLVSQSVQTIQRTNVPSPNYLPGSQAQSSFHSGAAAPGNLVGNLPSGNLISGSISSGSIPSGNFISGSVPSGSIPSGNFISGSIPPGNFISGSIPSGSIPSGNFISSGIPSGVSAGVPTGNLNNRPNFHTASHQEPEVLKHVYFYQGHDEPAPQQRVVFPQAPPKKNYKIIFVKAPSYIAPPAPIIPPQPHNEEQTRVYVLVKKPEEPAPIVIPHAAQANPSKPEVFFIKYNTEKDAQEQINDSLNGNRPAIIANSHDDGRSFVEALARPQGFLAAGPSHDSVTVDAAGSGPVGATQLPAGSHGEQNGYLPARL